MSDNFSASEYSSDHESETRRNSESDSDEESQLVGCGAGSRLRPASTALKCLWYHFDLYCTMPVLLAKTQMP